MILNNVGSLEGDINYLVIEYLKQLNFKSNSEKEEIIRKVYILFIYFNSKNFSSKITCLMGNTMIYL